VFYDEVNNGLRLHGAADSNKNFLSISGKDRFLVELGTGAGTGKGKNSSVYRAVDPNGDDEDLIIKFCQYHNLIRGTLAEEKRRRFIREIDAVKLATSLKCDKYLIGVVNDGYYPLSPDCAIPYYVMEEADFDLGDYLEKTELSVQQKLLLFFKIMKAMQALHSINLYHRDLKPDNIFSVDGEWKLGDLGFASFRDDDLMFDGFNQKIGPAGLMSPEATNKLLANRNYPNFGGDCDIDAKSDVYQLGNIFWFIMQGDIPTGQLLMDDYRGEDPEVYEKILYPMLQHAKSRRPSILDVLQHCEPIFKRHGVA
jgi:serine/threonine protein kinase